jgi:hypothetical protein
MQRIQRQNILATATSQRLTAPGICRPPGRHQCNCNHCFLFNCITQSCLRAINAKTDNNFSRNCCPCSSHSMQPLCAGY